jgi:hypothetical protein
MADPDTKIVVGLARPIGIRRPSNFTLAQKLAIKMRLPLWTIFAFNWLGPTAAIMHRRSDQRYQQSLTNLVDVEYYFRLAKEKRHVSFLSDVSLSGLGHHEHQITATINPFAVTKRELSDGSEVSQLLTKFRMRLIKIILALKKFI